MAKNSETLERLVTSSVESMSSELRRVTSANMRNAFVEQLHGSQADMMKWLRDNLQGLAAKLRLFAEPIDDQELEMLSGRVRERLCAIFPLDEADESDATAS